MGEEVIRKAYKNRKHQRRGAETSSSGVTAWLLHQIWSLSTLPTTAELVSYRPQQRACVLSHFLLCHYLTLWDAMDCSPPGISVHGILQARILEWLATPSSFRWSSQPRDQTSVSYVSPLTSELAYEICLTLSDLTSLSVIISRSIQVAANGIISFLFMLE